MKCRKLFLWLFIATTAHGESAHIAALKKIISHYERPITALVIVANEDIDPILSLASEYPANIFVVLNNEPITATHLPSNIIKLDREPNPRLLTHLYECEHFDLVFSDYTHFRSIEYADALKYCGEHVLIATKDSFLQNILKIKSFELIHHDNDGSALFLNKKSITFLPRPHWICLPSNQQQARPITSNLKEKYLTKLYEPSHPKSPWHCGINLMTFKALNGSFPSTKTLSKEIVRLFNVLHPDWMPNNIIVTGSGLRLIDFDNPDQVKTVQSNIMLALMLKFVQAPPEDMGPLYVSILNYNAHQLKKHPQCKCSYDECLENRYYLTIFNLEYE